MRHLAIHPRSADPLALAVVTLVGLAVLVCLIHTDLNHDDLDMVHGGCGVALVVSSFAAGLVFVPMNWWLLATWNGPVYAVSPHLPDPPPKSSPRL